MQSFDKTVIKHSKTSPKPLQFYTKFFNKQRIPCQVQMENQEQDQKITEDTLKQYWKSGYKIVGPNKHTGVEVCRWAKKALKTGKYCYKALYGVKSHRCLQMTPTVDYCTLSCVFCWRRFVDRSKAHKQWDDAKTVLDEAIKAQRQLLIGFGGNRLVDKKLLWEALHPAHVAISLDGEPTLYPYIVGLVEEILARGMTAFLVTNGTIPERLQEFLERNVEPTNLYLSLYATNQEDYERVTHPFIRNVFKRVVKSLEVLKLFKKARTIIRLTMVKGLNMQHPEEFANLALKANPWFIELKGFTWTGAAMQRLPRQAMPTMQELNDFAKIISEVTGYEVKARDAYSRVVVMVRDQETWDKNLELIKRQDEVIKQKIGTADTSFNEKDFKLLHGKA